MNKHLPLTGVGSHYLTAVCLGKGISGGPGRAGQVSPVLQPEQLLQPGGHELCCVHANPPKLPCRGHQHSPKEAFLRAAAFLRCCGGSSGAGHVQGRFCYGWPGVASPLGDLGMSQPGCWTGNVSHWVCWARILGLGDPSMAQC